ncbi:MAG: DUF4424 family protein [Sphingomicrobium sp.]
MGCKLARIIFVVAMVGPIPGTSRANDSVAEMAAGGLVLTGSREIDLVSEDLFVSEKRVRVDYVFINRSAHDVARTIAFPMPDEDLAESREIDVDFPHNFRTVVDGRPVHMRIERRAILD